MRRVHPTGWRGDGLAPVKTLRALIFVISGHGSRPSGGLQERSNWKDIDSAGKLSIDYGVTIIFIAAKDEETTLPKLFYSKVPAVYNRST